MNNQLEKTLNNLKTIKNEKIRERIIGYENFRFQECLKSSNDYDREVTIMINKENVVAIKIDDVIKIYNQFDEDIKGPVWLNEEDMKGLLGKE